MVFTSKNENRKISAPKIVHKMKNKLSKKNFNNIHKIKDLDVTEKDHGISAIMNYAHIELASRKVISIRNLDGLQIPNLQNKNTESKKKKSKKTSMPLKIGFKIFSLNLERVFFIVIIILITTPFFRISTYSPKNRDIHSGVLILGNLVNAEKQVSNEFKEIEKEINRNIKIIINHRRSILYLQVVKSIKEILKDEELTSNNTELVYESGDASSISSKRPYSLIVHSNIEKGETIHPDFFIVTLFINNEYEDDLNAVLNILNTIFVIFIFSLVVREFRLDTVRLLVKPMRKMKKMVNYIKKDPIRANNIIDYYFLTDLFNSEK